MQITNDAKGATRPPSGAPAAATWVAGTGAFLLVAAAAVFIAVSWERLPESAKLAMVAAVTGACIAGGRALRRTLPATGDVVFHLGAFLLPVDVAGLGLRAGAGWRSILLAEGVVGVVALGALAASSGSVVLAWASTASMVVLAGGLAAVSPVPATVPLALAALGAHLLGHRRPALAWSAAATFAPLLGFALASGLGGTGRGAGVLAELGMAGGALALGGALVGAVVLGREAQAGGDPTLAGLAVAGGVSAAVTTWAHADIPAETTVLALPVAFLAVEAIAVLTGHDPFWRRPARAAAAVAETAAVVVGGLWTAVLVLAGPIVDTGLDLMSDVPGWVPDPAAGAALATLAVAWAVAGARRCPPAAGLAGAAPAMARPPFPALWCGLALVAAVEVGTASGAATAAALVIVAAGLLWTGAPLVQAAASALALWAPLVLVHSPGRAWAAGAAASMVVGLAAAAGPRSASPPSVRLLGAVAVAAAAAGTALSVPALGPDVALGAFVAQAWVLAALLGQADRAAGNGARAAMVAGAVVALSLAPAAGLAVAAMVTAALAADAVRLGDPGVGVGAAAAAQVVVVLAARLAQLDLAGTGLVLVMAALVWSGLAALVEGEWRTPFLAGAALGVGAGLLLASGDQRMLAHAVVVSGGMAVGAGVLSGSTALAHAGGAAVTAGIFGHLSASRVAVLEPFVAPVAAQLVVAGWQARRRRLLGSWAAYGPAVALLGGAALAERLAGGPAWHALVAGAVGVAAVAAGGWYRLAAPLLLGTGLLVAVTTVESLAVLAGVPTWAWLALGGSLLLGTGVALERADTSPGEAGRRLVDVIGDRFE